MAHILVLDADRILRSNYVAALEAAGHSAIGVSNAQTAIGACETRQPDVIVLELHLREHSGVEFLHELRSYSEWQEIPVILNTMVPAKDLAGLENAFKAFKIVNYAYKPETSLKKIVNLVEGALPVRP